MENKYTIDNALKGWITYHCYRKDGSKIMLPQVIVDFYGFSQFMVSRRMMENFLKECGYRVWDGCVYDLGIY